MGRITVIGLQGDLPAVSPVGLSIVGTRANKGHDGGTQQPDPARVWTKRILALAVEVESV